MEGEAGPPKAGCSPIKSRSGCRVVSAVLTAGYEEGRLLTGPILQVHAGGEGVVNCLKEDGIRWGGEKKQSCGQAELGAMQGRADSRSKMGAPGAACMRAGLSEG